MSFAAVSVCTCGSLSSTAGGLSCGMSVCALGLSWPDCCGEWIHISCNLSLEIWNLICIQDEYFSVDAA